MPCLNLELMLLTFRPSRPLTHTTRDNCSLELLKWLQTPKNSMRSVRLLRWNFSKSLSRSSQRGLQVNQHAQLARSRPDHLKLAIRRCQPCPPKQHLITNSPQMSRRPCWTSSTREMRTLKNLFTNPWFGKCQVLSHLLSPKSSPEFIKLCKTKARMIEK